MSHDSHFLSLCEGASVVAGDSGQALLQYGQSTVALNGLSAGNLAALQRIGSAGDYEDRLTDIVLEIDGSASLAKFYYYLNYLGQSRLLRRSAHLDGVRLATLVPTSRYFEYASRSVAREGQYRLSRFAYCRVEGNETLLESPLSHSRIILHDARASMLIHALAQPVSLPQCAERVTVLLRAAIDQLMTLLLNAGMLTEPDESGLSSEETGSLLQSWEFHDLLFHARSRVGRHDLPVGGQYRFLGRVAPPPALKPPCPDRAIDLFRPDLEQLTRQDPPYILVQETRRSIRRYDTVPITIEQIGEFLFRVGRVARMGELEVETPRGPVQMEFAARPYPAPGGLYEMELYLAVAFCVNLPAGLYRYEPRNHRLEPISEGTKPIQGLLTQASQATAIAADRLQVMIIMASRFQRLSWKYSAMSYAATLKHVGVLYQAMYLAATAMGLAPCAVGCGDSDLFARVAGTGYYDETSVGEFLLGSKPRQ